MWWRLMIAQKLYVQKDLTMLAIVAWAFLLLAHGRQEQVDLCGFEATAVYIANSKPARAT